MSKSEATKNLQVVNFLEKWTSRRWIIIDDYMQCHLKIKGLLNMKREKQSSEMISQQRDTKWISRVNI